MTSPGPELSGERGGLFGVNRPQPPMITPGAGCTVLVVIHPDRVDP